MPATANPVAHGPAGGMRSLIAAAASAAALVRLPRVPRLAKRERHIPILNHVLDLPLHREHEQGDEVQEEDRPEDLRAGSRAGARHDVVRSRSGWCGSVQQGRKTCGRVAGGRAAGQQGAMVAARRHAAIAEPPPAPSRPAAARARDSLHATTAENISNMPSARGGTHAARLHSRSGHKRAKGGARTGMLNMSKQVMSEAVQKAFTYEYLRQPGRPRERWRRQRVSGGVGGGCVDATGRPTRHTAHSEQSRGQARREPRRRKATAAASGHQHPSTAHQTSHAHTLARRPDMKSSLSTGQRMAHTRI